MKYQYPKIIITDDQAMHGILSYVTFLEEACFEVINRLSLIKWKCIQRVLKRHDRVSKYWDGKCSYCYKYHYKGYLCKIDRSICGQCGSLQTTLFSRLEKKMRNNMLFDSIEDVNPLIEKIIKKLKEANK